MVFVKFVLLLFSKEGPLLQLLWEGVALGMDIIHLREVYLLQIISLPHCFILWEGAPLLLEYWLSMLDLYTSNELHLMNL